MNFRKSIPLIMLLVISSVAAAETQHRIEHRNDTVHVNTVIQLDCDQASNCPVNSWRIPNWPLPEDAEIKSLKDSYGSIDDYSRTESGINFNTNRGDRRRTETVEINFTSKSTEHVYRGLYKTDVSLPGFNNVKTSGTVKTDDLISTRLSHGFDVSYGDDSFNFSGRGPVSLRFKTGQGNNSEYFTYFGSEPPENDSIAYTVPVAVTGIIQGFDRFPVVVKNPESFNQDVGSWSAGEYVGGKITIRKGIDNFRQVLAHETVHALNDREFNWDRTSSSYIDEGLGKHIEHLVNLHIKGRGRTSNLFGNKVEYFRQEDGQRYRITLPSKGKREDLWNYYRNSGNFMKSWRALDSSNRSFGYAYSELIVKNHIVNENGSVRDFYISPENEVTSKERKWQLYAEKIDMTPCKTSNRTVFDKCLDNINNHKYTVPSASVINKEDKKIDIGKLEVKERSAENKSSTFSERTVRETSGLIESIIKRIENFLANITG